MLLESIDEDEGTRDHEPLEIISSSTVKSAICNCAGPWKEVAVSTVASCWKQALLGADPDSPTEDDFEGLFNSSIFTAPLFRVAKTKCQGRTSTAGWSLTTDTVHTKP